MIFVVFCVMKKIKLYLSSSDVSTNILALKLHGFLMGELDKSYSKYLHENKTNPYASFVYREAESVVWEVSLLNEEAERKISPILIGLKSIRLENIENNINITKLELQQLTQEDLLEIFNVDSTDHYFTISFFTPVGFKSNGEYVIFPSIKLLFQSLMQKYNRMNGQDEVDLELLEYLCKNVKIVKYNLKTYYYQVHNVRIPAFIGKISIKINGATTLKSFIKMLLVFGEYSGVGIKTSLGMGGYKLENRKK